MDVAALLPSIAAVTLWTILLIRAGRGIEHTPRAEPQLQAPADELPVVTAFVPARNEARVIAPCVTALGQQGALIDRLIVIDDRSNDGTRSRLEEVKERVPNLIVLESEGPQAGECGKPAALRRAIEHAKPEREWLLFLDADVILKPGALRGLVHLAREKNADLLTIFPALDLETPIEKLVMPSIGAMIAAIYPADRVGDPNDPLAFANGQLILIRRAIYEQIGGHGTVVKEILEDVRLAELVKKAGGTLCLADGRKVARTRMYENWRELVEGWSKNLFLLLGSSTRRAIVWSIASVLISAIGLIAWAISGFPIGFIAYLHTLAVQMLLRARGGAPPGWALFAPIGAFAMAYILLRSTWLHTTKRALSWKGRQYSAR